MVPDQGDHLSLRKTRKLLSQTIKATLACVGIEEDRSLAIELALFDLETSSGSVRTGV